jgi:N-methylhydantoinase A
MKKGACIKGPAIIAENETSTLVGSNFRAHIDSLGYIVLERAKGGR